MLIKKGINDVWLNCKAMAMFSTTNILAFLLASNVLLVDEEVWAFSSIKKITRLQIATKKEIITTKDELGTAVYDVNDKHAVIG